MEPFLLIKNIQKYRVYQALQEHQKNQAEAEAKAEEQWLFDVVNIALKETTLDMELKNSEKSPLSADAKPFSFTFKK